MAASALQEPEGLRGPAGANSASAQQPPVEEGPLESRLNRLDQEDLEEEKLRWEILKLEAEIENQRDSWMRLVRLAPFITAIVGLVVAFIGFWKYLNERTKERLEREADMQQRLDEKFASVTADLGAEAEPSRVAAAANLPTFFKEEYSSLHEQAFTILVANLRIAEHPASVQRLLRSAFERSIALEAIRRAEKRERGVLDLSNCHLHGVDLTAVNLEWFDPIDLYHADLSNAVLRGAHLKGARGYGVNLQKAQLSQANLEEARMHKANLAGAYLHEARLVSIKLDNADLREAKFQRAQLQGARFEGADLRGAHFEGAHLADANFRGLQLHKHLDDTALRSLGRAENWQKAHFEAEVRTRIEALLTKKKTRPDEGKTVSPANPEEPSL